jgi:hypothetical protein
MKKPNLPLLEIARAKALEHAMKGAASTTVAALLTGLCTLLFRPVFWACVSLCVSGLFTLLAWFYTRQLSRILKDYEK